MRQFGWRRGDAYAVLKRDMWQACVNDAMDAEWRVGLALGTLSPPVQDLSQSFLVLDHWSQSYSIACGM